MNLKSTKLFLYSLVVVAATVVFYSCSSDDEAVLVYPPDMDSDSPATGIWRGNIVSLSPNNPQTYEMVMVMYMPPGDIGGGAVGAVWDPATEEGVRLFDGGYTKGEDSISLQDACPDPAYQDLVVGTGGYPVKEYHFITHSAGGESKTAKFCFALSGNTLTGTVNFDDLGSFEATLIYAVDNAIDSNLDTLRGKTWVDDWYYWSQDTADDVGIDTVIESKIIKGGSNLPGMSAQFEDLTQDFTVTANDSENSTCGGAGWVADVADHNLFIFGPFPEQNSLSDSNVLVNQDCDPDVDSESLVGHIYNGLGFIIRGADGKDKLITLITSFGEYNWPPVYVMDPVTRLCVIDPATWEIDPATWVIDPSREIDPDSDECVINPDTGECDGLCKIDPETGECAGDCVIDPVTTQCAGECLLDDPEALSPGKALYNEFE